MDKKKILILPGDGIGPEAIDEVKKIIDFLNKKKNNKYWNRRRACRRSLYW